MLTRAYDAIMASYQVPAITNKNVDFNSSAIDDSVLNCKNYTGQIRTMRGTGYYNGTHLSTVNSYDSGLFPFTFWSMVSGSVIHPDEDSSEPSYEDYIVSDGSPSGWTASSQYPSFEKTYDQGTKEIVCTVKCLWQNTSGAAKTVYGVKVRCRNLYRSSYSNTSVYTDEFLVCREHFASPVVVDDQGIISLTFTWRVGRAGLVSATAAAAE